MLVAGTTTTALGAESSAAPNPLLDLLIQKGFVTKQEAEKVQAEAEAIRTNGVTPIPESKWKISNGIKSGYAIELKTTDNKV